MAAQVIFRGIGGDPGGLLFYFTGGLESAGIDFTAYDMLTVSARNRSVTALARDRSATAAARSNGIEAAARGRTIRVRARLRAITASNED
jgi:hypothetical protein